VLQLRLYERISTENRRFRSNGVLESKFQVEWVAPRTILWAKWSFDGIKIWIDFSSVLSQCTRLIDGQTDRQTDGRTAFSQLDRVCYGARRSASNPVGSRYNYCLGPLFSIRLRSWNLFYACKHVQLYWRTAYLQMCVSTKLRRRPALLRRRIAMLVRWIRAHIVGHAECFIVEIKRALTVLRTTSPRASSSSQCVSRQLACCCCWSPSGNS